MTRTAFRLLVLLLLPVAICSCGDRDTDASATAEATPDESSAATTPAPPASAAAATGEAPVGPISSRGEIVPGAPAAAQGSGTIDFDIPKTWQSQTPSSTMRLAQAVIPGSGGVGELAVFYFGPGTGGSVDANIKRWVDQMESPDQPKPQTFNSSGFHVTWVDVGGTFKPSQMGMGPSTPQPNYRLLGAVIEGPGGPWFFKATGPDATLSAERDAFLSMLKSVRAK